MVNNPAQKHDHRTKLVMAALLVALSYTAASADVSLLGVQYVDDNVFPEYACLWHSNNYPPPCAADTKGAHAHVFIKNTGTSIVTFSDVTLAGYSLDTVIKYRLYSDDKPAHSIYHYWLQPPLDIIMAGEPVWFKCDPRILEPGQCGQAIIRLRWQPTKSTISVGVVTSSNTINTTIPVNPNQPELASVGFSEDLTKVHLHWRRSNGAAPATIKMDGNDVTANTVTVGDPGHNYAVSVITLGTPVTEGSYHVFQGIYADAAMASAGLRTRAKPMMHGSWQTFPVADYDDESAAAWIDTCKDHGINALINQAAGGVVDYLQTSAGRNHAEAAGYRLVVNGPGKLGGGKPMMWFLDDETDIEENTIMNNFCRNDQLKIPCNHDPTGIKGRHFIEVGELWQTQHNVPTTINMNGTFKPRNFYAYGQAVDSLMIDCYYEKRVMDSYYYAVHAHTKELYAKPTVIYATCRAGTTASEPQPFNILLFSCEPNPWKCREVQPGISCPPPPWPFSAPESKRVELYFALAGGAKGIGYWWFIPGNPSNGLGDQLDPRAQALWREIGLLGAEMKTVQQLLATGCPVDLDVTGSTDVWVRALAVSDKTMILLVVNDNLYNDDTGCHYTPVPNATVTVDLPSWLTSPTVFDVDASGIGDVTTQINGNELQLDLGTLDVTRMIIVTRDTQLRTTLEQRYTNEVAMGVCRFAMDECALDIPPEITLDPQPCTICTGGAGSFTAETFGSEPFSYQWQKNQSNLSNGGHFSGVTTSILNISSADLVDAANYRCVVTNAFGSATSNEAKLTILECNPSCLMNLGFENGFTNGAGTGWTKFVKYGTEGGNLSFSDEMVEVHSGAHSQEIFSQNNMYDGGVYQRFNTSPGESYILKAWFKVYSPNGTGIAEGLLGLDPTGGTDPNSPNIVWSSKPYEYWSMKSWPITAQSNYITVYLRGHSTKASKSAYVWVDDVELTPGPPTVGTPQAVGANGVRWKWTDVNNEIGYHVRDAGGTDKSGLLPADTTEWTETTGIAPNTQYTRYIHAVSNCGESDPSAGQTARTLSAKPQAGSVTPSTHFPAIDEEVIWTAVGGFGAGTVEYYRYVWDQNTFYTWTGTEPQWSTGTLSTVPTTAGTWYLHVQGYNADNIPNGTYDYVINAGLPIPGDYDDDRDVDAADVDIFIGCFSGPMISYIGDCEKADFDLDNDVDLTDFGAIQRCYSGENTPGDPYCAN